MKAWVGPMIATALLLLCSWPRTVSAFTAPPHRHHAATMKAPFASDTALSASPGDWLEGFKNSWNPNDSNGNNSDDEEEELAAGTSLLLSVPVSQLKPGGLRLFLMFSLMGMQNTPDRSTWRAHQPVGSARGSSFSASEFIVPSDDEPEAYVLEMIHRDGTGIIMIELVPVDDSCDNGGEIRILRSGSAPSNSFLMQESVVVDGILKELKLCAFDESIPESDRLLIPEPTNAIDLARQSLAFG